MTDEEEGELRFAERFRQSHHTVATYMAMGWTDSKISQVTGKSRRSLTILRNTPLFRELMAQKKRIAEEQGQKATEELLKAEFEWKTLAMRNLIQGEIFLAERWEQADLTGELPSVRDINLVTSDRADRLGYSKHSITHHTADFGAQLDRAILRSNRRAQLTDLNGDVVDGEVLSLPDFSNEPTMEIPISPSPAQAQGQSEVKRRDPPVSAPGPSIADALRRRFA